MAYAVFELAVKTINQKILEHPVVQFFRCDLVLPQNLQVVRNYDANECIVATEVFLFNYAGDLFGTKEVKTVQEFIALRNARCISDSCCYLLSPNGCYITINGNRVTV